MKWWRAKRHASARRADAAAASTMLQYEEEVSRTELKYVGGRRCRNVANRRHSRWQSTLKPRCRLVVSIAIIVPAAAGRSTRQSTPSHKK